MNAAEKETPQCRAGWTRHILGGVSTLSPPLAARVLAAVPLVEHRKLEQTFAIGWLPFDVHMAVLHALRTTLGASTYQQLCAAQVLASLHNPVLFAKPARAALRLYGASPFAIFRAIPPSLNYIFRNAGRLRISTSENGRQLDAFYEGFPPSFSEGDTWSLIWTATFEAIAAYVFEGSPTQAHVALTRHDPKRGYFEWHVHI
jgi:hypothetical protein